MRPVNLIPVEQRLGRRAALRGGPVAYIVIGALVAALAGVTLLVATSNQVSESKVQVAQLERENAVAKARATSLTAYTKFKNVHDQRIATVTKLADSRFDWERVMRELALVLPRNVWLTNLTGTDNPQVVPSGGASIPLRASISGPALEIVGCASGQVAVAGFVQALKEIGGVTRVGVQSSALGTESSSSSASSGSAASTASAGANATCRTRNFIAGFQIVAAFDAAPVPIEAAGSTGTATSSTPPSTTSTTSASPSSSSSSSNASSTSSSSPSSKSSSSESEGGEG